jgi:hypothetical protein
MMLTVAKGSNVKTRLKCESEATDCIMRPGLLIGCMPNLLHTVWLLGAKECAGQLPQWEGATVSRFIIIIMNPGVAAK